MVNTHTHTQWISFTFTLTFALSKKAKMSTSKLVVDVYFNLKYFSSIHIPKLLLAKSRSRSKAWNLRQCFSAIKKKCKHYPICCFFFCVCDTYWAAAFFKVCSWAKFMNLHYNGPSNKTKTLFLVVRLWVSISMKRAFMRNKHKLNIYLLFYYKWNKNRREPRWFRLDFWLNDERYRFRCIVF